MMNSHQFYMQQCLELALQGRGYVSPNPMVGAVLVHEDKVIGQGYHERIGQAHAEVNCINSVSVENRHLINSSTLYVSLEPCSHHGLTPPCADFILQHGIQKVVVACRDSSSKVNGRGIARMKEHGIEVIEDVLKEEAISLNERFFTSHAKQRPFIILKWAESAEGFIGQTNKQIKLSGVNTDKEVHQWRANEDAIWVGFKTVLIDNPQLNVRHVNGKNPLRIVIDRNMELQGNVHLLNNEQSTIIFNHQLNAKEGLIEWRKINPENEIMQVLNYMHHLAISSVIVEGGAQLLNQFIKLTLWDEARIIRTNTSLDSGISSPLFNKEKPLVSYMIDDDQIQIYKNTTSHP